MMMCDDATLSDLLDIERTLIKIKSTVNVKREKFKFDFMIAQIELKS